MPTLASSSGTQIGYIVESAFGTIPVAGNYAKLRITGESLDFAITKEASKELNSTRSIASVTPTTANASGGIQAELSYLEYDTLMAATLQSTWTVFGTAGVSAATTISFTALTLTASAPTSGTSDWSTLKGGQFFRVTAPSDANDGLILRVSTVVADAPTTTVIKLDASTPVVVSAGVANCTINTSRLTNGTTQTSYSIERQNADITEYLCYSGMTPSKMTLNLASAAMTTLSFDFMGKTATLGADVTNLPGTAVASKTYDVISGVTGSACLLWEAGVPITGTYVKSLTMSYDNALRSQEALCTLGAVGIGSGTISLTGSMSIYFADSTLFTKFKNNTNSSITFSMLDASGNGYVVTLPVVNISAWKTTAGGQNSDMMVDVQFIAMRDDANATAALQKVAFIDRVGAAA